MGIPEYGQWQSDLETALNTIMRLKRYCDRVEADSRRKDAEIKRLREALAWYVGRSAESLMFDGGRRASEALSGGHDDA